MSMMAQTVIELDDSLNTFHVYFNVYVDGSDVGSQFKIVDETFMFRGYKMSEIGECDFYNVSAQELASIRRSGV